MPPRLLSAALLDDDDSVWRSRCVAATKSWPSSDDDFGAKSVPTAVKVVKASAHIVNHSDLCKGRGGGD